MLGVVVVVVWFCCCCPCCCCCYCRDSAASTTTVGADVTSFAELAVDGAFAVDAAATLVTVVAVVARVTDAVIVWLYLFSSLLLVLLGVLPPDAAAVAFRLDGNAVVAGAVVFAVVLVVVAAVAVARWCR